MIRNPIYLAFNLFPIGFGIFFDNLWVLMSFIPIILTVYHLAIKKEEKYLEANTEYNRNVRRWL
mgnify:CR=1 FL=1